MKKEIEDRIHLHKNLEQLYEGQLKSVKSELDRSVKKNEEYEKMVKHMRKKSVAEKDEIVKLKNELAKQRQGYDEIVSSLRVANRDLETEKRDTMHHLNTEISTLQLRMDEAHAQMSAMNDELLTLRSRNTELLDRVKESDKLSGELDVERCELATARRRIQELETDLANHGEWKNLSKAFQARLAKATELERECERLTRDNKNLHETIGNKLLLEEQVHDLKARLEAKQRTQETHIDLDAKLRAFEQEIKEWKRIAKEFCASGIALTPTNLRSYIDQIQKKHLVLTNDAGAANLEKSTVSDQIFDLRKHNENLQKANESLTTNLQNYKTGLYRLQKKLALIARERDCFKNLMENYERDLTISAPQMDSHSECTEHKVRIDLLEKSLAGYKEINETLEKELEMARTQSKCK